MVAERMNGRDGPDMGPLGSRVLFAGSRVLFAGFLAALLVVVLRSPPAKLFGGRFGRRHRVVGAVYLAWLAWGFVDGGLHALVFDVGLGVLGTVLTLTAAWDFGPSHEHAKAANQLGSGTLSDKAIVTKSEMLEHSFYQLLNLCQALYLHGLATDWAHKRLAVRLVLLAAVTIPWMWRGRFPVNKFSDNWRKDPTAGAWLAWLYRIKKAQYLVYKHLLLHGLNITMALDAGLGSLVTQPAFRAYWLGLNTAYTSEFFLQTLVRRRFLSQRASLVLNQVLMLSSSLAALLVCGEVNFAVAAASCALNFLNRGQEITNVGGLAALWLAVSAI